MNRQTPGRSQPQSYPAGYRPSAPLSQASNGAMFYATAGQLATQSGGRQGVSSAGGAPGLQQGGSSGAPGFPPLGGGLARGGGPPGFAGRTSGEASATQTGEFPALGSHSTYASQAQTSQQQQSQQPQAPQPPPSSTSSSNNHLPPAGLFMQGAPGLAPPPPPGIGASPGQHPNGLIGDGLRGEDFPALGGEAKDRLASLLRNQPSSPPSLVNGTTASTAATPSTNPPMPGSSIGGPDSWSRSSPSRLNEPVTRPVQQIMSSPVDRWGLKALLYEIKMSLGKSDRGTMLFGEDLAEIGLDVTGEDPLYPLFVTPWLDPSQIPRGIRVEDSWHVPSCYNVVAPPIETKIANFQDDTLFFAFYSSPQDVLQLEVARELYNRGWRYHTEMQVWLTSPSLAQGSPEQRWVPGPFWVYDPATMSRTKTADEFMVDVSLLEATRPAAVIVQEEQARKESTKSPNGNAASGQQQQAGLAGVGFSR